MKKEDLYKNYVSTHTNSLYGEVSKDHITKQFPIWNAYFGKLLPRNKEASILDIGCGDGGFILWLQSLGYTNVQGVDISLEQVNLAKTNGVSNVVVGDFFQTLPSQKDTFDFVIARDVLEHIAKDKIVDALLLIRASLRGNGNFIAQTANAENPLWGRLRHGDFTHELAFTNSSVRQVLMITGFNTINVLPQRPVVHGLASLIRFFLWRFIEIMLMIYLFIETGSGDGIFTQNIIVSAQK